MSVASLELCKELYELSGWEDTSCGYFDGNADDRGYALEYGQIDADAPAYDLDYLLQAIVARSSLEPAGVLRMLADYIAEGESFADAACRLAIRLFEDGILEKAA